MTMGRRRTRDRHLPRRLYLKSGSYYFVHADGRWQRLLNQDGTPADYGEALTQWAALTGGAQHIATLGDAFDGYKLEVLPKKSPRSQKNNLQQFKALYAVFRDQRPQDTLPSDIYAFMDRRKNKHGRPVHVQANREVELLSDVFNYLIRKGVVEKNPCKEVKRFTEKPRDRDVEAWEFEAVYALASPRMQCAMEIARLTGDREGDIIRLTRQNLQERGVYVVSGKTKRKKRNLWTPALRAVIDRLIALQGPIPAIHLFLGRRGRPLSESGFQTEWQRLMGRAVATGAIQERFHFHDIRAMAAGEHQVPHELLANDPATARRVYDRKPKEVMPTR